MNQSVWAREKRSLLRDGNFSDFQELNDPNVFRMADIVFPDSTNHYGTLFAGNVIALMVRTAFLTATRFTRQRLVLASTERIDCSSPIQQGSIVELIGRVVYSGKSSLSIRVDLISVGNLYSSHERAASGYFSFAAVNEVGRPVAISKEFHPTGDLETGEWKRVERFREFRKEIGKI